MKHITLNNKTVLKSPKQTAVVFKSLHEEAYYINKDLETCKEIMKSLHDVFDFFTMGVEVVIGEKYDSFDKKGAIKMLREKGATEKEIKSLTKKKKRNKVKIPNTQYPK